MISTGSGVISVNLPTVPSASSGPSPGVRILEHRESPVQPPPRHVCRDFGSQRRERAVWKAVAGARPLTQRKNLRSIASVRIRPEREPQRRAPGSPLRPAGQTAPVTGSACEFVLSGGQPRQAPGQTPRSRMSLREVGARPAPSKPCPTPGIELASHSTTEGTAMTQNVTLLDLVDAVAEHARSEAEVIATIVCMVNQGHVRLCGTFKGARFDLTTLTAA